MVQVVVLVVLQEVEAVLEKAGGPVDHRGLTQFQHLRPPPRPAAQQVDRCRLVTAQTAPDVDQRPRFEPVVPAHLTRRDPLIPAPRLRRAEA